jgi:predicted DNA-binding helix-hairpin-helix protein
MREHRLYQADYLYRQYGFTFNDLLFDQTGNLDLSSDPKLLWARHHPEFFPVSISKASKEDLLKVPGIGPILANRIVTYRKNTPIGSLENLKMPRYLLEKAREYLVR